jgi:hypothetical protein
MRRLQMLGRSCQLLAQRLGRIRNFDDLRRIPYNQHLSNARGKPERKMLGSDDDRPLTMDGIKNKRIRQRTLRHNQVPEPIGLSSGFRAGAGNCKWSRVSLPVNRGRRSDIHVALERGESHWLLIL